MQDIQSINTTRRDQMVCPECHTTGFEELKAISSEYSGKAKILKASRCSNTDCKFNQGLPPEIVQAQFDEEAHSEGLISRFKSVLSKLG